MPNMELLEEHKIHSPSEVMDVSLSPFYFENKQYLAITFETEVDIYEVSNEAKLQINRKIIVNNALKTEWTNVLGGEHIYLAIGTKFGEILLVRLT